MINGNPLKILLIEDNSDHAELVMRCFDRHKVLNSVTHLSDGHSALEYLYGRNQFSDRDLYPIPDLILLDLRIPKIDGLEVLVKIKEDETIKHIPVVILTSSANEKDINIAYKNYVNSYLVKPLDFNKFMKLIEELGFYWLCWNKSAACRNNEKGES